MKNLFKIKFIEDKKRNALHNKYQNCISFEHSRLLNTVFSQQYYYNFKIIKSLHALSHIQQGRQKEPSVRHSVPHFPNEMIKILYISRSIKNPL